MKERKKETTRTTTAEIVRSQNGKTGNTSVRSHIMRATKHLFQGRPCCAFGPEYADMAYDWAMHKGRQGCVVHNRDALYGCDMRPPTAVRRLSCTNC